MEYSQEQIKVLTENKVIPKDASPLQIAYFFEVCKRKKLDPFTKQIHMIERNERDGDGGWKKSYTIQASIDGMRAIAQRNGTIHSIKRYVKRADGTLYGCCEITTKDGGVYSDELSINEYAQKKKDGTLTAFWQRMPETMIKKCAEESVLRMVSPEDLSGVYGDDEMNQADDPERMLPKAPVALPESNGSHHAEVAGVTFTEFDPVTEKMMFGREHKGTEWVNVPVGYLQWMAKEAKGDDKAKAIQTLNYLDKIREQSAKIDDLAPVFDEPKKPAEKKNRSDDYYQFRDGITMADNMEALVELAAAIKVSKENGRLSESELKDLQSAYQKQTKKVSK